MKNLSIKILITSLMMVVWSSNLMAQTRIRFAKGRTSASVSGQLVGYGERKFVLSARYGQLLSANVSSKNGCVTFSNGVTSTSYITKSGDNALYLVNKCRNTTAFTLTVSINFGSD